MMVHEVVVAGVQFDVKPPNIDPAAGVAVKVTTAPWAKLSPQTVPPLPQEINGVAPFTVVTDPIPEPTSYTFRTGGVTVGAAAVDDNTVTFTDAVITEPLVVDPIAVIIGE